MGKLEDRYPAPSRTGRAITVAAVSLLAAVGLLWLVWTAWVHSHPDVVARVAGFHVDSDTTTRATVTIDRARADLPVRCFVYAQAATFEHVGEKWVDLPAGKRLTDVQVELRTFRRATSVSVERCEAAR